MQYPQRYQLKKVEGTEDIVDLTPAPGEVYDEGTMINKATLLKDTTAALYGLGTDAVPDDVLKLLGNNIYNGLGNQYLWSKNTAKYILEDHTKGSKCFVMYGATSDKSKNLSIKLYPSYVNNGDGTFSLTGNPVTITSSYNTYESVNLQPYIGYYATPSSVTEEQKTENVELIYEVIEETTTANWLDTVYGWRLVNAKVLKFYQELHVDSYVNSPFPNTYPPSIPDGYIYKFVGRCGDKSRIVSGKYIGTGKVGYENPNKLVFPFKPLFGIVQRISAYNAKYTYLIFTYGVTSTPYLPGEVAGPANISWGDNSVEWANGTKDPAQQMNELGVEYFYVFFG